MTAQPRCPHCHTPVRSLLDDCPKCVKADNDRDYGLERALEDNQ